MRTLTLPPQPLNMNIETEEEFNASIAKKHKRMKLLKFSPAILVAGIVTIFALVYFSNEIKHIFSQRFVWISALLIIGSILLYILLKPGDKKGGPDALVDDDISSMEGNFARLAIFLGFHAGVGYGIWYLLNTYFYVPFLDGGGWFLSSVKFMMDWGTLMLLLSSVWSSFNSTTIDLNQEAELLYFGKPVFSNLKNGFNCLGLPMWLASEIKVVDFKQLNILIGLIKNGIREAFVIESENFDSILDVNFEAQPNNTRKWLALGGDIEKRLVAAVNSAINEAVNRVVDGEKVFKDINVLKSGTVKLHDMIMNATGPTSLKAKFSEIGFTILGLNIKDVENPDKSIITAAQALEAKRITEEGEMLNIQSTADKVLFFYDKINKVGTPAELVDKEKVPMSECIRIIERQEGGRSTMEVVGGKATFVDARGDKK